MNRSTPAALAALLFTAHCSPEEASLRPDYLYSQRERVSLLRSAATDVLSGRRGVDGGHAEPPDKIVLSNGRSLVLRGDKGVMLDPGVGLRVCIDEDGDGEWDSAIIRRSPGESPSSDPNRSDCTSADKKNRPDMWQKMQGGCHGVAGDFAHELLGSRRKR